MSKSHLAVGNSAKPGLMGLKLRRSCTILWNSWTGGKREQWFFRATTRNHPAQKSQNNWKIPMTKSWHPYSGKACFPIRTSRRLPTGGSLNFGLSLQNADLVWKQLRQTSNHLGHWPSREQGLKMTLVMFNRGPAAKIALLGRRTSHRSDVCYFRTYHGWKQAGGTCSQNIKAGLL